MSCDDDDNDEISDAQEVDPELIVSSDSISFKISSTDSGDHEITAMSNDDDDDDDDAVTDLIYQSF
jgi:hypothetical protein